MSLAAWIGGNGAGTRLAGLREALRASYWFVPGTMTLLAAILGYLLVAYQDAVDGGIAGSMATVAGTVFSVTMVALTLAAGQFSPRVLRSFMRDRTNQVVLGGFVGTFTYALIVLRGVRNAEEGVPNVAVTLVLFIHHIAQSVQVSTILHSVTQETLAQIPHLFPDPMGTGEPEPGPIADVLLRLAKGPGDFVSHGSRLATVWPADRCTEELADRVRASFVLARYPSIESDVQFGVRALSPGVNDPTTGTNAVDYLGVILSHAIGRRIPSPYRRADGAGRVRIIAEGPSFGSMVHLAFDQICRYGKSDPRVLKRVLQTLAHLAELTSDIERHAALVEMTDEVMACAARGLPDRDRRPLETLAAGVRAGRAAEASAAKVVH